MKQFTVSIIGVGARGGAAYGEYIHESNQKFRITALCDIAPSKLKKWGDKFGVPEEERYSTEEEFFQTKRSDLLLIAVLDADHVRIAKRALSLGYHILLEKPISGDKEELYELLAEAKKTDRIVMVCHVLRYTVAFRKMKQLLDEGAIGKLVAVDALEQIAYWHFAHSYVRGNWRVAAETTPSIMAKCCHDLDLLQYFAGSRCISVSSVGSLNYFNPENAPKGHGERCLSCAANEGCPYDAKAFYLNRWKRNGCPSDAWPFHVLSDEPTTEEVLLRALENGPYGECVFLGKNDVADNQTVIAAFENGVNATLRMMAFTAGGGRKYCLYGSHGEIEYNEEAETILLKPFGKEIQTIRITDLTDNLKGHGGGDYGMIDSLYLVLCGENAADTSIANSVESHLMAIAAEESRLQGGVKILIRHE
ncbi:MAG: Gfo/Idh/MocA family oxidoreductase [Clostridia bacterium]|nr:Gfo/Idh/MocA family oxidoreductase [Clostridia bacterium]